MPGGEAVAFNCFQGRVEKFARGIVSIRDTRSSAGLINGDQ